MGGDEETPKHPRERGHSHSHRHRDDEERHRHRKKRRRHADDRESHHHKHRHDRGPADKSTEKSIVDEFEEDLGEEIPQEPQNATSEANIARQSWMTEDRNDDKSDPFSSFLGAPAKEKKTIDKPKPEGIVISARELNTALLDDDSSSSEEEDDNYTPPTYTIGDAGSSWRMMKLKNLYAAAKESMRPVEEVALERLGSLRAFDEAREEEIELDRRKRDRRGEGVLKVKVTGELHQQRLAKQQKKKQVREQKSSQQPQPATTEGKPHITQSDLNKFQAALLRAEMTNSPDVPKLAADYEAAVKQFNSQPSITEVISLPASHSKLLPHLSREHSISSNEMTIEDMVKEERASKRASNVDRIARDRRFKNDLDYMDENAERLANMPKRKEIDLKSMSVQEYKKQQRIVENCPLCYKDDGKLPLAPVISLGTRVYLSLPTEPELTSDGAIIAPIRHARNLAECDDDEWEEIRVHPPLVGLM
jgi:Protein similar to CwfJ C-terminus 1